MRGPGANGTPPGAAALPGPVAFVDGECNLCDRLVRYLLDHDRRGELWFAPLQGETAAELRASIPSFPGALATLVVAEPAAGGGVQLRQRSGAAIRALELTGHPGWLTRLMWTVPRPLRDLAYRLVARSRYRLFGRKSSCRLPTAAERARLLP